MHVNSPFEHVCFHDSIFRSKICNSFIDVEIVPFLCREKFNSVSLQTMSTGYVRFLKTKYHFQNTCQKETHVIFSRKLLRFAARTVLWVFSLSCTYVRSNSCVYSYPMISHNEWNKRLLISPDLIKLITLMASFRTPYTVSSFSLFLVILCESTPHHKFPS